MRPFDLLRSVRLVALLVVAGACGSASMGGGIAGTSSVLGAISGFGSVIVGGIEFDTSTATVTIDGSPAPASDLELGMVAVVRGVVEPGRTRGVAESITSDDLAEGTIEAIDVGAMRLTVLGQIVLADASTVFDPVPLAGLAPEDVVQVSGFLDAQGRIRATRIERKPAGVEIELKGSVQDLDAAAETFRINALVVDFSGATIEGAPDGLRNGLFVEVEGDGPAVDGVLTAVGVETFDPALMTNPGEGVKVEGFVTAVLSGSEIVVNGTERVRITSDTRFEGGNASDLVVDAQVDVEGVADSDGTLVASEVELVSG